MYSVLVIGCGALGGCLAGLLSKTAQVTVIDRGSKTRDAIRQQGLRFRRGRGYSKARVCVVDGYQDLREDPFDLVIVATKVMGLRAVVREANAYIRAKRVFFPQNGLFDLSWASHFLEGAALCRGVTTMACRETGPGSFDLAFQGRVFVAGREARWIARLFKQAGVSATAFRDHQRVVWAKLIFNAVMNPLPVITGRGYDMLRVDDALYPLARRAVMEGKSVAAAEGVRLAFDPLKIFEGIRSGRYGTIDHMGSTFLDVMAGRPTEMRYITVALLGAARRHKIAVPALGSIYRSFLRQAKKAV